jgi:hypothetical protein
VELYLPLELAYLALPPLLALLALLLAPLAWVELYLLLVPGYLA